MFVFPPSVYMGVSYYLFFFKNIGFNIKMIDFEWYEGTLILGNVHLFDCERQMILKIFEGLIWFRFI